MKIFLVEDITHGNYDVWWELVIIANDEESAKKIFHPHPVLASDLMKEDHVIESLMVNDYREDDNIVHWASDPDNLKVTYLGESDSTEDGIIAGFNGGT